MTMKKTYIQPSMTMAVIASTQFVCASKGVKGRFEEEEINYGGVDAEGGLVPAALRRRRHSDWDEEDEEQDW